MIISSDDKTRQHLFSIYSINGILVHSGKVFSDEKVDVTFLKEGIYFIQLNPGGKAIVRKIIISR